MYRPPLSIGYRKAGKKQWDNEIAKVLTDILLVPRVRVALVALFINLEEIGILGIELGTVSVTFGHVGDHGTFSMAPFALTANPFERDAISSFGGGNEQRRARLGTWATGYVLRVDVSDGIYGRYLGAWRSILQLHTQLKIA